MAVKSKSTARGGLDVYWMIEFRDRMAILRRKISGDSCTSLKGSVRWMTLAI